MATLKELKTLRPGDVLRNKKIYFKILKVKKRGLRLTKPFFLNQVPTGKFFFDFRHKQTYNNWEIVRANDFDAKLVLNKISTL